LVDVTKSTALSRALEITFAACPPARSRHRLLLLPKGVIVDLYQLSHRVQRSTVDCRLGAYFGASLTSTADSSPMAVRTMTSGTVSILE
jgi:hypothetical protein